MCSMRLLADRLIFSLQIRCVVRLRNVDRDPIFCPGNKMQHVINGKIPTLWNTITTHKTSVITCICGGQLNAVHESVCSVSVCVCVVTQQYCIMASTLTLQLQRSIFHTLWKYRLVCQIENIRQCMSAHITITHSLLAKRKNRRGWGWGWCWWW